MKWNDEVLQPELVMQQPKFEVRKDLLYHISKGTGEGEEVARLLVPWGCRGDLIQVAHTLPIGGHLGQDKIETHLLRRFFWPGTYKEMERFCETCPTCQKVSSVYPRRVPLISMLVVKRPFDWIV